MIEIRLSSLVLVLAATFGFIVLPAGIHSMNNQAGSPQVIGRQLPTPTPVPVRGLSIQARMLALSLTSPPASTQPTPFPPQAKPIAADVHTDGRPLNIRAGPGLDRPILGSAPNGLRLNVIGRSADGQWLAVELPGWTRLGWVFAPLTVLYGDPARLPVQEDE